MIFCRSVYWRFKGEKTWKYGWPTRIQNGLVRMGLFNGDSCKGPVVSEDEIESIIKN